MLFFWQKLKSPWTVVLINLCVAIAVSCVLIISESWARGDPVSITVLLLFFIFIFVNISLIIIINNNNNNNNNNDNYNNSNNNINESPVSDCSAPPGRWRIVLA